MVASNTSTGISEGYLYHLRSEWYASHLIGKMVVPFIWYLSSLNRQGALKKKDVANKYQLYQVHIRLIIEGTIPRVPPFSLCLIGSWKIKKQHIILSRGRITYPTWRNEHLFQTCIGQRICWVLAGYMSKIRSNPGILCYCGWKKSCTTWHV